MAIVEEKVQLMHRMAKALAKEEGITDIEALSKIKAQFMDRNEIAETINQLKPSRYDMMGGNGNGTEETTTAITERSKIRIKEIDFQQKQLELQQKQLELERQRQEAEAKKQELEAKRIESEEKLRREKQEIEQKKIESEEKLRREELAYQKQRDEENRRAERERERAREAREEERAATERIMLYSTLMGGKKGDGDGMLEFLKSQSESNKEFYKAQGENQKGVYEAIINSKEKEKDREMLWKTEIAKIEADRDMELAKFRQEYDASTSTPLEAVIGTLGSKFDALTDKLAKTNNADDFVNKMNEYQKMQEGVVKASLGILKARGMTDEQLEVVKSAVTSEKERQDDTLGELWKVGKTIWKSIEPSLKKEAPPQDPAVALAQQREAREREMQREAQIKRDMAEQEKKLTAEQTKLEEEKAILQHELLQREAQQRAYDEERSRLAEKAAALGIQFDGTISNERLFGAIEKQEALNERQRQAAAAAAEVRAQAEKAAQEQSEREQADQKARESLEEATRKKEQVSESLPETVSEVPDEVGAGQDDLSAEAKESGTEEKPRSSRSRKGGKAYIVKNGDQTVEVEAKNHRGAALRIANTLGGTEEAPVRITVEDSAGEAREYETYCKNKVPRVKSADAPAVG